MTISSTTRRVGPFVGNGVAHVFSFPFKVFKPEDILVKYYNISGGFEQEGIYNVNYFVTLNPDQDATPGGTIDTFAPVSANYQLTISSDQPELQETDITNEGGFYPETITAALDRLTIDVQELKEQADRSLRYPLVDPIPLNATLPPAAVRAGQILTFGVDGSIQPAAPGGVRIFSGSLLGTKDGVNKIFTMTNGGSALGETPSQSTVWNNFPLIPGLGYSAGPGVDQVTFTTAPDPLDILYAQGIL